MPSKAKLLAFGARLLLASISFRSTTNDDTFLDALEGFVAGGLWAGDGVIVIATPSHRKTLETRLWARGIDVDDASWQLQYIVRDAQATLSEFLIQGWPNEELFNQSVQNLLMLARQNGRRVRAFGEMVALLWAQNHQAATIRLERLWHQFCQTENFSLLCSYPKAGFTQDAAASMQQICETHTRTIEMRRSEWLNRSHSPG